MLTFNECDNDQEEKWKTFLKFCILDGLGLQMLITISRFCLLITDMCICSKIPITDEEPLLSFYD